MSYHYAICEVQGYVIQANAVEKRKTRNINVQTFYICLHFFFTLRLLQLHFLTLRRLLLQEIYFTFLACFLQVYNQLVCNCHEDSKLLGVIRLVEKVYAAKSELEREKFGQQLQAAIQEFLKEFLQHMEEEEKVLITSHVCHQ